LIGIFLAKDNLLNQFSFYIHQPGGVQVGKQKKKTILVVDDEQDTRIFLYNLLRSEGLRPVTAKTKIEGLQKAVKESPVVIILDMMIPGGGGIQMYNDLKHDEKLRNIPVIMLSTLEKKTIFNCRKVHNVQSDQNLPLPDVFLEKPLETDEILKIVHRLVHSKQKDKPPGSKHVEA
jgi:CheY-like chemotaxis protein